MPRKEDLAKYLAINQKSSINYFNHPFYVFGYTLKTNYSKKKRRVLRFFPFLTSACRLKTCKINSFFGEISPVKKKRLFLHMVQKVGRQKYKKFYFKNLFSYWPSLWPSLAKSSGRRSSPLWLQHKTNPPKNNK
jgi:hypothetical protein